MKKNLANIILKASLIGAIVFGNPTLSYAPPTKVNMNATNIPYHKTFRGLRDNKDLREITKDHKPRDVKKTNQTIVSYNGEIDTLYVPEYKLNKNLGKYDCGKYSSNVAEDLFGLKYNRADSWDLKYSNKVVMKLDQNFEAEDLDSLVNEKILQPGMKVLCHNPKSKYNWTKKRNHRDIKGNKVDVTHDIQYIGQDATTGSALFAHGWTTMGRFKQEVIGIEQLKAYNLQPREIIDAPKTSLENLAQN
jgi:hypothetical protein